MEALTCRLLPFALGDGAVNMAADEVLLHGAERGEIGLRFYGWIQPTVSLGYFQPAAVLSEKKNLRRLPWVRRPTGGATLVHHFELTYALALPPSAVPRIGENWMTRFHRLIAAALANLGIEGIEPVADREATLDSVLCFGQHTRGDLLLQGHKVVGSAQRRHHRCLLQHGAILLAGSPTTPELPGIADLAGKVVSEIAVQESLLDQVRRDTNWTLQASSWSEEEKHLLERTAREKYLGRSWNERR